MVYLRLVRLGGVWVDLLLRARTHRGRPRAGASPARHGACAGVAARENHLRAGGPLSAPDGRGDGMRNAFEGVGSDDVKPISLDYPRPDRLIIVRNSTQSGEFLTLP